MYAALLHAHSGLRYIVVLLGAIAVIKSIIGWLGRKEYQPIDNKIGLFFLISTHIQFVIGLGLYFVSPVVQQGLQNMGVAMKDPILRFYTVEHATAMLVGVALITAGYSLSKRAATSNAKFQKSALFFLIGMAVVLSRIPAGSWF